MKLTAAILFAATNAQRDGGRVRDKEVSTDDSAFADYFGSNFDYNGAYDTGFDASSYESFGDDSAFGDLNFGSYDDSYSADADADADEGRPIEVVDDAEKSTFEDGDAAAVALESIDTVFSERCYNSVGTDKTSWLAGGSWQRCNGETEACEVKVVRRGGAITQIHSKCANQFSCISNMQQNFNPRKINTGTTWYTLYAHQACRPLQMPGFSAIGPRLQKTDSTCFFCVEPCRSAAVTNFDGLGATVANADAVRDANCIGKSHTTGHGNSRPIASRDDVDLMAGEDKLSADPAGTTADATSVNFYSTIAQVMQVTMDGHIYKDNRVISYIQKEQKTFTG